MARPKLTPEQVEVIRDARRAGTSAAEISRELRVPLRSVQRALAGGTYPGYPPPPPTDAAADANAAPTLAALSAESVATGRDMLEIATAAIARTDAAARAELDAGNVAGYAVLMARLTQLVTAVRQLEAQRSRETAAEGGVFFTREELQAGEALVMERIAALQADRIANGGMTCVRCGEQLRMGDALRSIGENATEAVR